MKLKDYFWFGFSLLCVLASIYMFLEDSPWAGFTMMIAAVSGLSNVTKPKRY